MEPLSIPALTRILRGESEPPGAEGLVDQVATDSRRVAGHSAFFALAGTRTDGHNHVGAALEAGAVAAVVRQDWTSTEPLPTGAALIRVVDPLGALQELAAWWRRRFGGQVVAVTGSNGKTIAKDALARILAGSVRTAASPGSYNSQLGVPLSILRIPAGTKLAVLEAGISAPGEMDRLEAMLAPDHGILTNVGLAHVAAFGSRSAIAAEKIRLFRRIPPEGWVLAPAGWSGLEGLRESLDCRVYGFGPDSGRDGILPWIESRTGLEDRTLLRFRFPGGELREIPVGTRLPEIIQDLEAAACAAHLLGVTADGIASALTGHEPARTRMEIWRSPMGVTLINDACSSDPIAVQAALRALGEIRRGSDRALFVFGGMRELGELEEQEHRQIGEMAARAGLDMLVLVGGPEQDATEAGFRALAPDAEVLRYPDPRRLAEELRPRIRSGDTVLFKGPRSAGIGRAAQEITEAMAPNRLMVDLGALAGNVDRFRRMVGPGTRILGMVKALAYGSDLVRVSRELQNQGIDALGVSTPDEGIQLRRSGVDRPILVLLCTPDEADKVVRYHLTPVVYSLAVVEPLARAATRGGSDLGIHLKVDTGMGRLGVRPEELPELVRRIEAAGNLRVEGLMTHLSCAEDPAEDPFTEAQLDRFDQAAVQLTRMGHPGMVLHAAATAGTVRFPRSHYDMVRIGLGLYGAAPSPAIPREVELELAVSLLSRIAEIRLMEPGDRIGYGGTYRVETPGLRAGIIPMGYNDGLPWRLSNQGRVLVEGRSAPLLGRISMDSAVVDLTEIPEARIGSDVLIYGSHAGATLRPEEVAMEAGTIVYELLTRLGSRVERIFVGG